MKFKLLIVFIFVCIMFTINKSHAQSLQNNDIQNLFAKIEVLHGKKNYYNVIELVNDNIEIIKKANQEWKEVINSYKYNSQYEIHNIAYNYYQKRDYIEAQKMLAPIITEIKDSISLNVCNKDCCIPWSSCLWLYGKINQGLGNTNEALSLLNEYHEYVSKNLECFLTYEEGNYTKYAYVVFWSDLAYSYEQAGLYKESVQTFLEILEYSQKEYPKFLFKSIMNVGYAYNAPNTSEGRKMANVYFIKALDYLNENSQVDNNVDNYLDMLIMVLCNCNLLNNYHQTIEIANKYIKDWTYNDKDNKRDKLIEINNTRAQAYEKLDFYIPNSYEISGKIRKEILEYYETSGKTNTEQYAIQLRYYADNRQLKEAKLAATYYKKAMDVWDSLPNKDNNIEYLILAQRYIASLEQSPSNELEIRKIQSLLDENILLKDNDVFLTINYYRTKSLSWQKQNNYHKGDSLITIALDICKNSPLTKSKEIHLDLLVDKISILFKLNQWAEADNYCNKALLLLREMDNKNLTTANALETIALYYMNLGNMQKVHELNQQAIDIRMQCTDIRDNKGNLDLILAIDAIRFSPLEIRILMCQKVINICDLEKRKSDEDFVNLLIIYAESLSYLKQYEKADSLYESIEIEIKKCCKTSTNGKKDSLLASFYKSYSTHECRKGDLRLAAQLMELSCKLDPSFYNKNQVLSDLYAYLKEQNQYEFNLDKALEGIRTDIQYGFTFMTEKERDIFMSDGRVNSLNHYGEYAYLMPNSKIGMRKIYDSALLYKGVLLNTIREFSHIISTSNNDSIKSIYTELQLTKRDELTEEIKRKEKILLNYIRENHSYSDLDLTWKDIQNNLKENECAVEFLKFKKNQWIWCNDSIDKNNHYIALIVTPQVDSPIYIDLFDESILEKAIACGSNLYRNNYGEELSRLIWGKINEIADNANVIYFSPIGLLNLLNIESLKDDRNYIRLSSTRELCKQRTEDYQTAILYGGLVYDSNDYRKEESIRVIEDALWYNLNDTTTRGNYSYLPGTEVEVNNIAELLDKSNVKTTCFTGKYGTIDSFRNISGNSPSVLHIATHATWDSKIDNKDLKAGGLLFASVQNIGDVSINERINFISAKEISTMDLSNTSLAVLSACQTGIGKITDDGVWGIQRAFKMAGVKTILMSLWKVDDIATALMMTTFYKELLATNNKHIAYKRAQQKVREKFENPYYWAGFIMLD